MSRRAPRECSGPAVSCLVGRRCVEAKLWAAARAVNPLCAGKACVPVRVSLLPGVAVLGMQGSWGVCGDVESEEGVALVGRCGAGGVPLGKV